MTLPVVDPTFFADAQSLATLKRQAAAHDPRALRAAAQQFESLFLDMVLKSAQAANFKDPLMGSSQERFYQDLYDQQLASDLSKTHKFGLAEMLVQQLRRQWAGSPSGSTASAESQPAVGTRPVQASPVTSPSPTASDTAAGTAPVRASSASPVSSAQQSAFARSLWPEAQKAAHQLGVSPVGLIAQAALETDWGRRMPRTAGGASSNNLFGIKATGAWHGASVRSGTQEYVNGTARAVQASFRAYGSCGQCFQDYTALLGSNPRYAGALGTGNDVGAFASALQQAGYATDPNYARKLTAVADTLSRTLATQNGSGPLKLSGVQPMTTGSDTL